MISRFARKGYLIGFGVSVVGHIVLLLAGQTGLIEAIINTILTGLLLWGVIGAIVGALIGAAWRLLHPAARRPTTLPPP